MYAARLHIRFRPGKRRRGAVVILVAILLPIFLAVAAFSVDIAYIQYVNTELQVATDSAARAAGEALSRHQSDAAAVQAAKDAALANVVAGVPLVLEDSDIQLGHSTIQPDGSWLFQLGVEPINSINVTGQRTRPSASGSVALFFGQALGVPDFQPVQSATVVRMDRDLALVVDRSSSMKLYLTDTDPTMSSSDPRFCQPPDMDQSRWGALSVAVDEFLTALATTRATETVGLASYASSYTACGVSNNASDVDQELTADGTQVTAALGQISNRVFNGATNISAGIDDGVAILTNPATARPFAFKTMVVFTDGHYNKGRDPVLAAQDAAAVNIVVHTVTFGDGANQSVMAQAAAVTGGKHYHAPDAATLQDIFREIALTMPVVFTE